MLKRLLVLACVPAGGAEVVQRGGLAVAITQVPAQGQRAVGRRRRVLGPPGHPVRVGQAVVQVCLPEPVAAAPRRRQAQLEDLHPHRVEHHLPLEVRPHGGGQLPHRPVHAGDLPHQGDQQGALGGEPGQRGGVVGQRQRVGRWRRPVAGPGVGGREQQVVGGRGGVQGEAEQPVRCHVVIALGGQLAGVGAQQVVAAVPVGRHLVDQVRLGQRGQRAPCPGHRGVRERGHGVHTHLGRRYQSEQVERGGLLGAQRPVGPGEHRPHRAALVTARAQRVQSLPLVGQLLGDDRQRAAHPVRHDAQRQRQPGAQPHDLGDRRRLGLGPALADDPPHQGQRLGLGQQVHRQPTGALGGGQPVQAVPRGHQHQAAR
ncbi:putative secreted protein [Kutzneria albida DSM 43870]|uniref:Putative secreted protein n=1 Tax=Kutzneria albida DSM 43870 TaxID=1449976 RepID=W5W676_9PSEU|nr:putative secreted protein [Kutzneria albida DSM 43870]